MPMWFLNSNGRQFRQHFVMGRTDTAGQGHVCVYGAGLGARSEFWELYVPAHYEVIFQHFEVFF